MISKTFDWYKIVSATPSSTAVEARKKAATELVASLPKQDPSAILAVAQGVACEFEGSPADSDTISWLLRTLKQHDPAVSENLSKNQMELRCIAAITLGEILLTAKMAPEETATVGAAAFVSAMNIRPLPKKRYLRAMLEELSRLALGVLESAADARRQRVVPIPLGDNERAVADLAAAKTAISLLQTQIASLGRNATMDREEISLFWFIASGFSRTKGEAFSRLKVSIAAVHAALELSRFLLIPAPLNCFEILAAVVEKKRHANDLKPVPLNNHPVQWSAEEWNAVAEGESPDSHLASSFPAVFPIIWIANRMREAGSLPNWSEFNKMTHLEQEANLSPSQLAGQLLREKIAVSLAGELLG